MRELRQRVPDLEFEGVGGPRMAGEGLSSLYPLERLSVMGLVEVLKHLPELLAIRKALKRHFLTNRPDVFIGVDAPDFNLGLEAYLKKRGIPTVHYVSPTVWAWRSGRVKKIRASIDLMLSIFPFEVEFLREHRVPVAYVGHPLADEIPLHPDAAEARRRLGFPAESRIVALLPGSRMSEVELLAETFLQTAELLRAQLPELHFVVPVVNARTRAAFEAVWRSCAPELPLTLLEDASRDAMLSAEVVLTASGTATLEALLLKRPMVVAYKVNPLTYGIVTSLNLIKTPHIAMANLLAGEALAPEFIQHQATPEALCSALLGLLQQPQRRAEITAAYSEIHQQLQQNSSARAADAVLQLYRERQ
jgi:lipid-A-disaccharide synthase